MGAKHLTMERKRELVGEYENFMATGLSANEAAQKLGYKGAFSLQRYIRQVQDEKLSEQHPLIPEGKQRGIKLGSRHYTMEERKALVDKWMALRSGGLGADDAALKLGLTAGSIYLHQQYLKNGGTPRQKKQKPITYERHEIPPIKTMWGPEEVARFLRAYQQQGEA